MHLEDAKRRFNIIPNWVNDDQQHFLTSLPIEMTRSEIADRMERIAIAAKKPIDIRGGIEREHERQRRLIDKQIILQKFKSQIESDRVQIPRSNSDQVDAATLCYTSSLMPTPQAQVNRELEEMRQRSASEKVRNERDSREQIRMNRIEALSGEIGQRVLTPSELQEYRQLMEAQEAVRPNTDTTDAIRAAMIASSVPGTIIRDGVAVIEFDNAEITQRPALRMMPGRPEPGGPFQSVFFGKFSENEVKIYDSGELTCTCPAWKATNHCQHLQEVNKTAAKLKSIMQPKAAPVKAAPTGRRIRLAD